jgi:chloramphenicol 3-O-phosphotransferase
MDSPPPSEPDSKPIRIAIVGPCSAGKSTLAKTLKSLGFDTRQPAQEHSYVPDMWRRISRPDVLIYLDVDVAHLQERRPHLDGGLPRLLGQQQRLAHARQHCDFYLDTSPLSADEVWEKVVAFLRQKETGVSG